MKLKFKSIITAAVFVTAAHVNAQSVDQQVVQQLLEAHAPITPNLQTFEESPRVVSTNNLHTFQVPAALIPAADTFITKIDVNKPARDKEEDKDPEERDPAYINKVKPEHKPNIVDYRQIVLTLKKNEVSADGKYTKQNFNVTATLSPDGKFYVGNFLGPILSGDEGQYVWGIFNRKNPTNEKDSDNIQQYLGVIEIVAPQLTK